MEAALGIAVMRHREKKPAGGKEEVEAHFGCEAYELLMVGDRCVQGKESDVCHSWFGIFRQI